MIPKTNNSSDTDKDNQTIDEKNRPVIEVIPLSLDFGDVSIAHSKSENLTIINNKDVDIFISNMSITSTVTGIFHITGESSLTIKAKEQVMVKLHFTPHETKVYQSALTISNDTKERPVLSVNLSGKGVKLSGEIPITNDCGTCDSPPEDSCSGGVLRIFNDTGMCIKAECQYVVEEINCPYGCKINEIACKADACDGITCNEAPNECYKAEGKCAQGQCLYELNNGAECNDTDPCSMGDICENAVCIGEPIQCDSPPQAYCLNAQTRRVYHPIGQCNAIGNAGKCEYGYQDIQCQYGCNVNTGTCIGNPCDGLTCDTPPNNCYSSEGFCEDGSCGYTFLTGQACNDNNPCTNEDLCKQGICKGGQKLCNSPPPSRCLDSDTLEVYGSIGVCQNGTGDCEYYSSTIPCEFGCESGQCKANPCIGVTCNSPTNSCYSSNGICTNGQCYYPFLSGQTCNDNDPCTVLDVCADASSKCIGSPKICNNPPQPECISTVTRVSFSSSGTCGGAGECNYTANYQTCEFGCTNGYCNDDPCLSMSCFTPPSPFECYALPGVCENGICNYSFQTNSECDDNNPCTISDHCDDSTLKCKGNNKVCNTPPASYCNVNTRVSYSLNGVCEVNNNGACTYTKIESSCEFGCTAGQCKPDPCLSITCNQPPNECYASIGQCANGQCVYTFLGATECNDYNVCTASDTCKSDTKECKGTPVLCQAPPSPACISSTVRRVYNIPGTCNTQGSCVYTHLDIDCSFGCKNGECQPDPCSGITCNTSPNTCFVSQGTCSNGVCSYSYNNNAACNDNNSCTTSDTCNNGTCAGTAKTCNTPPPSECHATNSNILLVYQPNGTCNTALGQCEYTQNQVTCPFGCNTTTKQCNGNPCDGVTCNSPPTPTACYSNSGTCSSGVCSYSFLNNSACNDSNPCTINDICTNGTCTGSSKACNAPPNSFCTNSTNFSYITVYNPSGTCGSYTGTCYYSSTIIPCDNTETCDTQIASCVCDPIDTAYETDDYSTWYSHLAWADDTFGIVYVDYLSNISSKSQTYLKIFDAKGIRTIGPILISGIDINKSSDYDSQITAVKDQNGQYYFGIVWTQDINGTLGDEIYYQKVNADTGALVGNPVLIYETVNTSINSRDIDMVGTENGFALVYATSAGQKDVYLVVFDLDGNITTAVSQISVDTLESRYPIIAWTGLSSSQSGLRFGIGWRNYLYNANGSTYEIRFALVNTAGSVLKEVLVASQKEAIYPTLDYNGTDFNIAWQDKRNGNNDIFLSRISASGTELIDEIALTALNTAAGLYPKIAWSGSKLGVSYRSGSSTYQMNFRTFDVNGNALTSEVIVSVSGNEPSSFGNDLIWADNKWLYTWVKSSGFEVAFGGICQ